MHGPPDRLTDLNLKAFGLLGLDLGKLDGEHAVNITGLDLLHVHRIGEPDRAVELARPPLSDHIVAIGLFGIGLGLAVDREQSILQCDVNAVSLEGPGPSRTGSQPHPSA